MKRYSSSLRNCFSGLILFGLTAVLACSGGGGTSGGGTGSGTSGVNNPVVSILYSPATPDYLTDVTVTTAASSETGIYKIDILSGLQIIKSCDSEPARQAVCEYKGKFQPGDTTYTLTANAYDSAGNMGMSTTNMNVYKDYMQYVIYIYTSNWKTLITGNEDRDGNGVKDLDDIANGMSKAGCYKEKLSSPCSTPPDAATIKNAMIGSVDTRRYTLFNGVVDNIEIGTIGIPDLAYFENIPVDAMKSMMRVADKYSDWTQHWD